jgi:hypothetical protein
MLHKEQHLFDILFMQNNSYDYRNIIPLNKK